MDYGTTAVVVSTFALAIGVALFYLSVNSRRGNTALFVAGLFFVALTILGLPVVIVDSIEYGNQPPCEWLDNHTDTIYVYGNNFTGTEHWTLSDYQGEYSPPPGPQADGGPGVNYANYTLFHTNTTHHLYNSCEDRSVPGTITAVFTIYTWLIWITLFAGVFGFIIFLFDKWRRRV